MDVLYNTDNTYQVALSLYSTVQPGRQGRQASKKVQKISAEALALTPIRTGVCTDSVSRVVIDHN
jgi:hypothetical protein